MANLPVADGKKIGLKETKTKSERSITLSMRLWGFFTDAVDLAMLCGVQVAIILFTISAKPLSIINKCLMPNQIHEPPDNFIQMFVSSHLEPRLQEHKELYAAKKQLAMEMKRKKVLEERSRVWEGGKTFEEYMNSLGKDELMQLKYKMEELKREAQRHLDAKRGSSSSNNEYEVGVSISSRAER